MGRKRFNHQCYSSAEERLSWPARLGPTLTNLKASPDHQHPSLTVCDYLLSFIRTLQIPMVGRRESAEENEFLKCRWKGIPERIQLSLEKWKQGHWKLNLLWHVPEPLEILASVAEGRRCVTLLTSDRDLSQIHELKFDCLGFSIHDLMHAYMFFHDPISQRGQIRFAKDVQAWLENLQTKDPGLHNQLLADRDFQYLISDMNSHPEHLRATLKHLLARDQKLATIFDPSLEMMTRRP